MSFFSIWIGKIIYFIHMFCVMDVLVTGVLLIRISLGLFNILIKSYYEWHTVIEVKLHVKNLFSNFFGFKQKEMKKINTKKEIIDNRFYYQSILLIIDCTILLFELKRICNQVTFSKSLWFHKSIQTQNRVGQWHQTSFARHCR